MRCKLSTCLAWEYRQSPSSLGADGVSDVQGENWPYRDSGELLQLLSGQLLSDGHLRRRLAASGPKLAAAYSWASIYPKILDVIDLAFHQRHQDTIDERLS